MPELVKAIEVVQDEWDSIFSCKQLIWMFFMAFKPPPTSNSNAKLAIIR